ncbi:MAG: hypothetical protein KF893_21860 [Caldilineaceae bacterium]|nr:hypothetical protein [Caldilineaceae bacterium]
MRHLTPRFLLQRAYTDPSSLTPKDVLQLQRSIGNQATIGLLSKATGGLPIQAKLKLGPVSDQYEQEADRVATQVVRQIDRPQPVQRSREDDEELAQAMPFSTEIGSVQRAPESPKRGFVVQRPGESRHPYPRVSRIQTKEDARPSASIKRTFQRPSTAQSSKTLKAVEKSTQPALQRFSFSSLFSRKKKTEKTPTISGPTNVQMPEELSSRYKNKFKEVGSGQDLEWDLILDMQANARISAQDSLSRASTLSARAKTQGRQLRENPSVSDKDPDMMRARQDKDTKSDIKRGQRADATVHAFTVDAEKQFDDIVIEIATLKQQVDDNNSPVTDQLIVDNNYMAAYQLATQSQQAAVAAQKKTNDLAERVRSLEEQAKLEAAKTRSGLQKPGEFGKEVDWGKLEMSASDAALKIEAHKAEILSYYLYLKADLGVVTNYMQQRARSLAKTYGKATVGKIMASGYARGRSMGIAKPLGDDEALDLLTSGDLDLDDENELDDDDMSEVAETSNEFGQSHALQGREQSKGKGNKYLDPNLKQGKWEGFKSWVGEKASGLGSTIASGAKSGAKTLSSPFRAIGRGLDRKVFRRDRGKKIAKAREIQGLELMSVFYTQARKRFEDAEQFAGGAAQKYDAALVTYDAVDAAKKQHEKGTPQEINPHVLAVGKSWEDVMEVAKHRAKLKDYKDQVAKESDKYSKYGQRAMGGAKRLGYTLAGIGGAVVKTLTGGLVGWEKVDKDGGYSAGLKLTTIWDEIKKIWAEFKQIYATFKGKGIRGLGGKVGAIIYSILKITSVILGVIKNLATAVALWSTIAAAASMGGAGAVTGVATSIALYAAVAKAVIDAVLLVWSIIASKKTADPRSRSKIRGDIARHGVGLGESLVTVASAGVAAGISGDYSAFTGGWLAGRAGLNAPAGAFGKAGESSSSQVYNVFNDNWSQNIGGKEFYYTNFLRAGANAGVGQSPTVLNKVGAGIAGGINDDNMRQMNIDSNKQLKGAEKEARGKTKDAKGKLAKFADKVKVGVYDMTHFWRTPTEKRREQKQEMGRMFDELAMAVENVNTQNQSIDEDSATEDN